MPANRWNENGSVCSGAGGVARAISFGLVQAGARCHHLCPGLAERLKNWLMR